MSIHFYAFWFCSSYADWWCFFICLICFFFPIFCCVYSNPIPRCWWMLVYGFGFCDSFLDVGSRLLFFSVLNLVAAWTDLLVNRWNFIPIGWCMFWLENSASVRFWNIICCLSFNFVVYLVQSNQFLVYYVGIAVRHAWNFVLVVVHWCCMGIFCLDEYR